MLIQFVEHKGYKLTMLIKSKYIMSLLTLMVSLSDNLCVQWSFILKHGDEI